LFVKIAEKGKKVSCFDSFEEIEAFLGKNLIHGSLLITMGAGDVDKVGDALLSR
jgi:UDP-N-acetylmuramate--alanine ligase